LTHYTLSSIICYHQAGLLQRGLVQIKFHHTSFWRLQAILSAAAHLITGTLLNEHIKSILHDKLHWLPVVQRTVRKIALMTHKHGTVFLPTSLHQLLYRLSRDNLKHFYLRNLSHHFKLLSHVCVPCPRSHLATLVGFLTISTNVSCYQTSCRQQYYLLSATQLIKVKVGFFYSATYAAMPRPAALYNHRKWQLIGKSQWFGSAMLQLQHTPPPQSTTPGLHPVSIHHMAPPVRGSKHPITAYYSVYRPRKDERLS